jgi:carboxylesterase
MLFAVLLPLLVSGHYPTIFPSKMSATQLHQVVQYTLDNGKTPDPCLKNRQCLVSTRDLTGVNRNTPVLIMVHGFSATTYEWNDLARYIDEWYPNQILYSKILLGGHGRSLEAFRKSTYEKWGSPVLTEYQSLVQKGFNHISLIGSSAGGAIILNHLAHHHYDGPIKPINIFLIDPMVKPLAYWKRWIAKIGSIFDLDYPPQSVLTPEELENWYGYSPFRSIVQLNELGQKVEQALAKRIDLPAKTNLFIWSSNKDPIVNPQGYQIIQQGVQGSEGGKIFSEAVDSNLHVFIRLSGRSFPITEHDRMNQKRVFEKIISSL